MNDKSIMWVWAMDTFSSYKIVKKIINEWDPAGLFPMAPIDEYELEICRIVDYIDSTKIVQVDDLSERIESVFTKTFGDDSFGKNIEDCKTVAKKIIAEIAQF